MGKGTPHSGEFERIYDNQKPPTSWSGLDSQPFHRRAGSFHSRSCISSNLHSPSYQSNSLHSPSRQSYSSHSRSIGDGEAQTHNKHRHCETRSFHSRSFNYVDDNSEAFGDPKTKAPERWQSFDDAFGSQEVAAPMMHHLSSWSSGINKSGNGTVKRQTGRIHKSDSVTSLASLGSNCSYDQDGFCKSYDGESCKGHFSASWHGAGKMSFRGENLPQKFSSKGQRKMSPFGIGKCREIKSGESALLNYKNPDSAAAKFLKDSVTREVNGHTSSNFVLDDQSVNSNCSTSRRNHPVKGSVSDKSESNSGRKNLPTSHPKFEPQRGCLRRNRSSHDLMSSMSLRRSPQQKSRPLSKSSSFDALNRATRKKNVEPPNNLNASFEHPRASTDKVSDHAANVLVNLAIPKIMKMMVQANEVQSRGGVHN